MMAEYASLVPSGKAELELHWNVNACCSWALAGAPAHLCETSGADALTSAAGASVALNETAMRGVWPV
jgi:hypothetical protein